MKKSYTFFCLLLLYSLLFTSCTSDELLKISDEHILLRAGVCYSVPGMYKSDLRGESVEILERDEYGRSLISCVAENFITGKSEKVLVMFGSEADGLSEELKNFATKNVTIEMAENVESLNLSISVGVVAYKLKQV